MSTHSYSEFGDLVGKPKNFIGMYIKRGKIVLNADGKIDDKNLVNNLFLERMRANNLAKKGGSSEKKVLVKNKKTRAEKVVEEDNSALAAELTRKTGAEASKKESEAEKANLDKELLQIKIGKLTGRLIDRDAAMTLFTQQFRFFTKAFHDSVEGFLTEVSKESGWDRNKHAEARKKLIKMINESVDRAVDDGKNHFQSLIDVEKDSKK